MAKRYWLCKSEPGDYSIDDLEAEKDGTAVWDGIRNYQARNLMRDEMSQGDGVLFYHSNATPSAVVGLAEVVKTGVPDPTAFEPQSKYHDPKSDPENPTWITFRMGYRSHLARPVSLTELRGVPALENMFLLRRGMRLSVQPVTSAEWKAVQAQARRKAPDEPAPAARKAPRKVGRTAKKKAAKKVGKKTATRKTTGPKKKSRTRRA